MTGERVHFESSSGGVVFDDTVDHFENALLRLAVDRDLFHPWLEAAGRKRGSLVERLRDGYFELKPECAPSRGPVRYERIEENPAFGVQVDATGEGWLVKREGESWVREVTPPRYEQAYFEGGAKTGYGQYLKQAGWRLEKAARQVRELCAATGLTQGRVLDVGSGYGFFRKALADAGLGHGGVEISAHARDVAKGLYGLETAATLAESEGPYDAVSLWDVIEHVPDAAAFLRELALVLRPGGFVALKTPNFDCPEAEIFGAAYHSLKREHLRYFTPASLTRVAESAGFEKVRVETVSHLLGGFFGEEVLRSWEAANRGADIIAYFRRSPA